MIPSELEELKQKYPLAFDSIKLPVRYDAKLHVLVDDEKYLLRTTIPGVTFNDERTKRQDQIGELIAHLLNQLQ